MSRFLKHIATDTQSQDETDVISSANKQRSLARSLVEELNATDTSDVKTDEHAYIYAMIPATTNDTGIVVLGLIAYMDTSPAYSGVGVDPQIVRQYDGGDVLMNPDTGLTIHVVDFPGLNRYVDQDLITADGSTLLGVGDKVGVAEIMALADYLLSHPEIRHGITKIGFTSDEKAGCGADLFDVTGFGADVAYTADGGELDELECENFSTASAKVHTHGSSIHPDSPKGKTKNAILMAMELQSMFPVFKNPMYTKGYGGSYHLDAIEGAVEYARTGYIIHDHDMTKLQEKKAFIEQVADHLSRKCGNSTIELFLKDSYFSMKEEIEPHMYLVDTVKAAMEDTGIKPKVCPIHGGTDGIKLSYMRPPCPNSRTGDRNFRGKYEFISIQFMEHVVELLLDIIKNIGV